MPLDNGAPQGMGPQAEAGRKKGARPTMLPLLAAIISVIVLLWLTFLLITR